jgi:hypothetical protein
MQDYEIHGTPHHHGQAYQAAEASSGSSPGNEIQEDFSTPFAISIRNQHVNTSGFLPESEGGSTSFDPNAQYVRGDTLKVQVNGGTAVAQKQQVKFKRENFTIPSNEPSITMIYAEVELKKEIGSESYSRVVNQKIEKSDPFDPTHNSGTQARIKDGFTLVERQLIGTIKVARVLVGLKVIINQLIGNDFEFGNSENGELSDSNGVNTVPGKKEFIVTVSDKLYKATISVEALQAVENTDSS